MKKQSIGFVGQGYVGKSYADDFEKRGFLVTRYSLEEEYKNNKELIKDCDVVFIAVPTPTLPTGFDEQYVRESVRLAGKKKIVVIKSTIIPGLTKKIQEENPELYIFHSPEFLSEVTALYEASHPKRNIIGIPKVTDEYLSKAKEIMEILPKAPYEKICDSTSAELIKYGRNCLGFFRIMFSNLLYDVSVATGADWKEIAEAMSADPDNGPAYMNPIHKSGRGAGGRCFIKDLASFRQMYKNTVADDLGVAVFEALEQKNKDLLKASGKDIEILKGVYGKDF